MGAFSPKNLRQAEKDRDGRDLLDRFYASAIDGFMVVVGIVGHPFSDLDNAKSFARQKRDEGKAVRIKYAKIPRG